jgi:hypothetical protein
VIDIDALIDSEAQKKALRLCRACALIDEHREVGDLIRKGRERGLGYRLIGRVISENWSANIDRSTVQRHCEEHHGQ